MSTGELLKELVGAGCIIHFDARSFNRDLRIFPTNANARMLAAARQPEIARNFLSLSLAVYALSCGN